MTDTPAPPLSAAARLHAQVWASEYDRIDRQLSPLGLAAMDDLASARGDTVLDIGCGTGQTLLQIADRVGPEGRVTGVDIAPALLDMARQRTRHLPQVKLIHSDTQALSLADASADAVYSRFGVMGFRDPVAAFANFRRILRPGGRLAFVCWRSYAENELDHVPLSAAGFAAPVDTTPFSLADPDTLRRTLEMAGFTSIGITAQDILVSSGNLDAMAGVLLQIGPLGRILRERPALRDKAETRLRAALAQRGNPSLVSLQASVWVVTAGTAR